MTLTQSSDTAPRSPRVTRRDYNTLMTYFGSIEQLESAGCGGRVLGDIEITEVGHSVAHNVRTFNL